MKTTLIIVGIVILFYIIKPIYYKIIVDKIPFLKRHYQNKTTKVYHLEKNKLWIILDWTKETNMNKKEKYNFKLECINAFLKMFPDDIEVLQRRKELIKYKK